MIFFLVAKQNWQHQAIPWPSLPCIRCFSGWMLGAAGECKQRRSTSWHSNEFQGRINSEEVYRHLDSHGSGHEVYRPLPAQIGAVWVHTFAGERRSKAVAEEAAYSILLLWAYCAPVSATLGDFWPVPPATSPTTHLVMVLRMESQRRSDIACSHT